jgi:proton-dependent oligopeptide transporter, POT family
MAESGSMRHPKALYYLFFVELWERFSYYGMRAILALYLVLHLYKHLARAEADGVAYGIYYAFAALVYATPVLGGMLADRFLGYRNAITAGGVLMATGLFMMATGSDLLFFLGLGFLVAGNGLFKPNISSMVGSLYGPGDPRRDSGFTIFYMGINIGALLSPLACAGVAEWIGYTYGFGLAGVGMVLGLIIFRLGIARDVFKENGLPPDTAENKVRVMGVSKSQVSLLFAVLAAPLLALLIYYSHLAGYLLYAIGLFVLIVVGKEFVHLTRPEREKILAIFILSLFTVMFWAFFEQAGGAITLFAARNVDLVVINAGQTNSINPLFIIALAIPFSAMWTWLQARGRNPSTPVKFGWGIAQLGLGFLIFAWGARFASETGMVPMIFLVLGYFLITTGELFISPIGLSMVTRLSPQRLVAFMMGVWFLALALAQHVAGIIARFTTRDAESGDGLFDRWSELVTGLNGQQAINQGGAFETLLIYTSVFSSIALVAFLLAVVALICAPLIRKLMHGEH